MSKVLGTCVPAPLNGLRVVGAMCAVLLLSACGGGDDGTEPDDGDVGTEATTEAEGDDGTEPSTETEGDDGTEPSTEAEGDVTSISVLRSPASGYEALYIAQDEGIFAKHGLEVEIVEGGAPQEAMPLMVNGQVQFAMSDMASLTSAVAGGIPITGVYPLQNALEGQDTSGLWVREDSSITGVADLEGANLAVPGAGGTPHVTTLYAMDQEGADPGALTVVDIPIPSQADALAAGDIDAAHLIGAFHYGAPDMGLRFLGDTTVDYMTGVPQILWVAAADYTESNPDVVEAFTAALEEVYEFSNDDVEARRDVMREVTEGSEEFIADVDLPEYQFSFDGEVIQTFVDAMVEFGMVDSAPSLDELFAEQAPIE